MCIRDRHTTANVRYYVKEKEPEPGAVRKGTSQPELDARSHEEVIPRNDAAEKQNEIPGRQIPVSYTHLFWVCFTLDYLFHRSPWKESITFKGGTSPVSYTHLDVYKRQVFQRDRRTTGRKSL